jgi:hypothetical protein
MRIEDIEFSSRLYIDKAVSLLMANRPYLLRFNHPEDPTYLSWKDGSDRDRRLMSLAHYMMGASTTVDFFGPSQDMSIDDLECLIFAMEVLLNGRMREAGLGTENPLHLTQGMSH